MKTVGVNDFVRRQYKGTGKTYSDLSYQEIAEYAELELNNNHFKEGYRDGVVIIKVKKDLVSKFHCPFTKIMSNTKLKAVVTKRQPVEENYIQIRALNGDPLDVGSAQIILYRNDVLAENNEECTDKDWELIAFHAIPKFIDKMPMGPITMMRNQLELSGGTKAHYSSEEWAYSVNFWQKYAVLED